MLGHRLPNSRRAYDYLQEQAKALDAWMVRLTWLVSL